MIRSLYFDDYFNSAYEEKGMGTFYRKKYRIRIYNCSDKSIKLERKKKQGSYIYKEAASLSKEEVYKILDGHTSCYHSFGIAAAIFRRTYHHIFGDGFIHCHNLLLRFRMEFLYWGFDRAFQHQLSKS